MISQVGHSTDGHCISGRLGDLAVRDPVSVQLHAGKREADPGHGQGKPGDVFQVATRQACSVLSNRVCGPALAHDPWSYRVWDVAGDRRTQCHRLGIVAALHSHCQSSKGGQFDIEW